MCRIPVDVRMQVRTIKSGQFTCQDQIGAPFDSRRSLVNGNAIRASGSQVGADRPRPPSATMSHWPLARLLQFAAIESLFGGNVDFDGFVDGLDAYVLSENFLDTLPAQIADPPTGAPAISAQVARTVPGDVNADGRVDRYDLDLVEFRFGAFDDGTATLADSDVNGDGLVDGLDINWLAAQVALDADADEVNDRVVAELFGGI